MAEIIEFKSDRSAQPEQEEDLEQSALKALATGLDFISTAHRALVLTRTQRIEPPKPKLPPKTHPDPEDRARARRDALEVPSPPPGEKIRHDVRGEMRFRWHVQWARMQAAKNWRWAADLDARWKDDRPDATDRAAQREQAAEAYREECLILMLVPAWGKEALAWKLKQADTLKEHRDQWRPVIAADEARLAERGTKGRSVPRLVAQAS